MEPSAEAGTSGEAAPDQSVGAEGADLDTAIAVIASYSPAEIVLRYALQENPMPPACEEREDFDSAIGFVDVSGFTALSEKLKKDETQLGLGSELLNRCASHITLLDAPPQLQTGFPAPGYPSRPLSPRPRPRRAALGPGGGSHEGARPPRQSASHAPSGGTRPIEQHTRPSMSAWRLAWQVHQPVL